MSRVSEGCERHLSYQRMKKCQTNETQGPARCHCCVQLLGTESPTITSNLHERFIDCPAVCHDHGYARHALFSDYSNFGDAPLSARHQNRSQTVLQKINEIDKAIS